VGCLAETPDTPPAETPAVDDRGAVGTLEDARLHLRSVGYCVLCDALVERGPDGACPVGHQKEAVSGRILLVEGEPVPSLPRFNWAAFLLPFVWGPAHGMLAGLFFLPIWIFVDGIVRSAAGGAPLARVGAAAVVIATLAFQYFFARRANGVAFRRVMGRVDLDEFVRRQRVWTAVAIPAAIALVAWAVWFDTTVAPTLPRA